MPACGIEELLDVALLDQAGLADRLPEFVAQRAVLRAVRAAVVVELDVEAGEVALVGRLHLGDQLFLAAAFLAGRGSSMAVPCVSSAHM